MKKPSRASSAGIIEDLARRVVALERTLARYQERCEGCPHRRKKAPIGLRPLEPCEGGSLHAATHEQDGDVPELGDVPEERRKR